MEFMPAYDIVELLQDPFFTRILDKYRDRPSCAAFVLTADGCIEWTGGLNSKGYPTDGDGLVHRHSWTANVGPIPPDHDIHHICRNKRCMLHLACMTHIEHAELERRTPKLNEWKVSQILRLLSEGVRLKEVAAMFGVTPSYVSKIKNGKRWKTAWAAFHEKRNTGVNSNVDVPDRARAA